MACFGAMKVVVIDPRQTATCEIADLHLAIKPGNDVLLFNGLLAHLAEHDALDHGYIEQFTGQFADALASAQQDAASLQQVATACDLPLQDVETFYRWFARTDKTVTCFSQGVNQSSSGTDKVNAIINCHLATGRIGKPGASPLSLTGQPNAMGGREVGGLANQLAAHMDITADGIDRVQRFWNAPRIATQPGLKAVDLFHAVEKGDIKAIWIMGTNPVRRYISALLAAALLAFSLTLFADELTQIIQQDLISLGYDVGGVDGELNTKTIIAISKFQSEHQLEVTGEPSPLLAGVIKAQLGGASSNAAQPAVAEAAPAVRTEEELRAAQQACLQQKVAAQQEANKKKSGFGKL